jgi:uncharacterized DUF497 family protein
MSLRFVGNQRKAVTNEKKHGVGFPEATTVFDDTLSSTIVDPDHSVGQERFLILGMSSLHRLLVVSHVEQGSDTIRIVSARRANSRERRDYEEGN